MKANHAQVSRLLKTARGQLDGILRMVDSDRYCMDIAHQISATQSILNRVKKEILLAHVDHCVNASVHSQNEEDIQEKLSEIKSIIEELSK